MASAKDVTAQTRSRSGSRPPPHGSKSTDADQSGCYTCRLRKVRCKTHLQTLEDARTSSSDCVNCHRLGLECRWHAPAPGEQYEPPPKKRRTIGQRSARPSKSIESPAPSTQSPGSNPGQVGDPVSLHENDLGWSLVPPDLFGGMPLDFDFSPAYGSLELNLAGEGLDFIPLPSVDPSMLQISDEAAAMSTELLEQEQDPTPQPATNEGGSILQLTTFQSPSDDSRRLIQHYLDVMKGYSKVDDRSKDANNLFISAFSKSLFFPPLFYAILSFSASHLAMDDPSYVEQAHTYDCLADESFRSFRQDENTPADSLLSALFVRVKKIHMTAGSVNSFLELIAAATDIVSTKNVEKDLEDSNGLIRRIVLRLAILDARASQYRLGGGVLVERLSHVPALYPLFNDEILGDSSADVSGLLRADIIRWRVAQVEIRMRGQSEVLSPGTDEIESLYMGIQQQIGQWESQCDGEFNLTEKALSSTTYGHFTVLSAFHSALLYLYTLYVGQPGSLAASLT